MNKLDLFFFIFLIYQALITIVLSLPGLIYFFHGIEKGSRFHFSNLYLFLHVTVATILLYLSFQTELYLKMNMDFIPEGILRFSFPHILIGLITSFLVFIYTKKSLKNGKLDSLNTGAITGTLLVGIIFLLLFYV